MSASIIFMFHIFILDCVSGGDTAKIDKKAKTGKKAKTQSKDDSRNTTAEGAKFISSPYSPSPHLSPSGEQGSPPF